MPSWSTYMTSQNMSPAIPHTHVICDPPISHAPCDPPLGDPVTVMDQRWCGQMNLGTSLECDNGQQRRSKGEISPIPQAWFINHRFPGYLGYFIILTFALFFILTPLPYPHHTLTSCLTVSAVHVITHGYAFNECLVYGCLLEVIIEIEPAS